MVAMASIISILGLLIRDWATAAPAHNNVNAKIDSCLDGGPYPTCFERRALSWTGEDLETYYRSSSIIRVRRGADD